MSDDGAGEKTELPSQKKLREAREKGQVPRSAEAATTVSLIFVVGYLWVNGGSIQRRLAAMVDMVTFVDLAAREDLTRAVIAIASECAIILAPVLGVCIVAAILGNVAQFGFLFSFESLTPSFDRINPASGVKRIFSMKQFVDLIKSMLKIVFLSALLYLVLLEAIPAYIYALDCGLSCFSNVFVVVLQKTFIYTALAFVIVAVADFAYTRHAHTKSLMMTKEEVKREYKESEGDPEMKRKRKEIARELVLSDAGGATRKATALVINPTHLAVAFRFREGETPLPLVVAKGRNAEAHVLRAHAEEAGVPVFRHLRLARALYADVEVGEFIPDELFDIVAEVLVWVARNQATLYQGRLPHGVIDMEMGDHRP